MPVYVDVLVIVNAFVNYLMLVISIKYLRFPVKRIRLLLASAVGSLFSLKIFLLDIPLVFELPLRAVMCGVISFTAFGFKNIVTFLKNVCVFFTVNILFGGLMSAIFYFFNTGMILYKNGTVYFDIDLKILAVTSVVSFAVVNAISLFISRKAPNESICTVTVEYSEKSVTGRGFFDTGNALTELFSGFPVIVAQYDAVKAVLPQEVNDYIKDNDIEKSTGNIRMIPVQSVGDSGILPSFRPDNVILKSARSEKSFSNVYIAVSRNNFFGGEFEFILNNNLTGEYTNESFQKAEKAHHKTVFR